MLNRDGSTMRDKVEERSHENLKMKSVLRFLKGDKPAEILTAKNFI